MSPSEERLQGLSHLPPEEALFTAARWAVQEFEIAMNGHGGLMSVDLERTMFSLAKAVEVNRPRFLPPSKPGR